MRKKFTMLLALLLACLGVMKAQTVPLVSTDTETYEYYITNYRNQAYYVTTTSGLSSGAQQLGSANSFTEEKAKVKFKLTAGGKLYATNTATELIVGYTTTEGGANSVQLFTADNDYVWTVKSSNNGGYVIIPGSSSNSWNMHGGAGNNIGLYGDNDGGSNWLFVPANEAAENAAAEYEASFVKSVEGFDNNSLYTFISNRNAKDYMMYGAEYTNVVAWYKYQSLAAGDDVINCQWSVYRSENGNYYMYNIGAKKFLGTASANNAAIPFAETPQTMELMFKVTSVETHPIMISTNGGDGTLNHNSAYNDGVSNWDNDFGNDSDPGNVHKVRRVADISDEDKATIEALVNAFESTAIFEELTTLIMDAKVAIAGANNGVGTLTAEAAETLNEAVVAAEEVGVSSSYADIEAAISTLRSAYDAAEYIIVVPTAGKYYTFASANENKGDYENALVYAGEDNKLYWSNTKKATDAAAVWYYDGSVLKNVHTGCYINGFINNQPSPLAETGETVTFDQTIGKGQTKIIVASRVMHTQGAQNAVVNWNSTPTLGSSSAFYVSEVDAMEISHLLNVSSVGWASLVLGYNATIPSGIKAYTVSSVANGYATLNEIDGVLPANTPVLIEATQGNYEFTFAESAASVDDNMLAGKPYHTYLTTVEGTTNYVLSVDANGENVGLYKKTVYDANTDADASTYEAILFAANKAYLPVSTSSDEAANAISLNRGEGTTSIDDARLTIDNVVIYDLTGRRVEKMEKGIYIVNGKKIIK